MNEFFEFKKCGPGHYDDILNPIIVVRLNQVSGFGLRKKLNIVSGVVEKTNLWIATPGGEITIWDIDPKEYKKFRKALKNY